jgi:dTDP-4-amino-4,6-dideoxygalactose transaminase
MQNWNRDASIWGQNYRLSNLQAALGRSQLKRVDSMNKKRSEIAKIYNGFFRYMPGVKTNLNDNSSFQMYYIEVKTHLRDLIVQQLNRKGVMASVHFDPPIHLQSAYSEFSIPLSNTERISKSVITLPMSSKLTKREAKKVCKVFSEVYKDLE